jgi:hypothetical protein
MPEKRTPFDSIEGSLEYIALLREAIETAKISVAQESERASAEAARRRLEALQLIAYKLDRLARHVDGSRRLLNDLRMLKRLLLSERQPDASSKEALVVPLVVPKRAPEPFDEELEPLHY